MVFITVAEKICAENEAAADELAGGTSDNALFFKN